MADALSVLFSEPKIPQCTSVISRSKSRPTFSALQRAENSSIEHTQRRGADYRSFQCSSASRKFLNVDRAGGGAAGADFQCSSASRKFLNRRRGKRVARATAFFQCSSASRKFLNPSPRRNRAGDVVAFQCSSASRKFLNQRRRSDRHHSDILSVLFSEPKIPQWST